LSGKKKAKNDKQQSDEADKDKEAGEEQKGEAAPAKQRKKFKCPCGSKAKSTKPPV